MVGTRIAMAVAMLLVGTAAAHAQPAAYSGLLTGHIGAAASGDVRDWTVTGGASMSVIDDSGLGVELDASHAGDFDSALFADSSITTLMLNVTAVYPRETLRPFLAAGAGLIRVRAALLPGQSAVGQTDTAWSLGGGALYMFGEAFGLRADVRYFRQFGRQERLPLGSNGALDFVRSSVGLTYSWPMR